MDESCQIGLNCSNLNACEGGQDSESTSSRLAPISYYLLSLTTTPIITDLQGGRHGQELLSESDASRF